MINLDAVLVDTSTSAILSETDNTQPALPSRMDSTLSMQLLLDSIEPHQDLDDSQMEQLMDDILRTSDDSESEAEEPKRPVLQLSSPKDHVLNLDEIKQQTPLLSPIVSNAMKDIDAFLLNENFGFDVNDLRRWCISVCVVTFDLDVGPALEYVYPPVDLSEDELKTICFSSFPDSNSTSHLGDTTFSFRFRSGPGISKLHTSLSASNFNGKSRVGLGLSESSSQAGQQDISDAAFVNIQRQHAAPQESNICVIDNDGFTYAYVLFRQKADKEIRRGYFQKSLVLLSPHPWHGFFPTLLGCGVGGKVMDALGSERGEDGGREGVLVVARTLIREMCIDIAAWPAPPSAVTCDSMYQNQDVEVSLLELLLPPRRVFLHPTQAHRQYSQIHHQIYPQRPTFSPTPAASSQLSMHLLKAASLLWELMILGEPILVQAETPKSASQVVYTLLELMKPVPFGGDYRPYFTIQDSEFKGVGGGSSSSGQCGMVLDHLRVQRKEQLLLHEAVQVKSFISSIRGSGGSPSGTQVQGTRSTSPVVITGRGSPIVVFDAAVESVSTKYKPVLAKDKKFLKEISDFVASGATPTFLDNVMRRHFVDLSDRFLQPLNRHYEGLITGSPLTMTLSVLRAKPEVKPFQQDTFLETIKTSNPNLPVTSKKALLGFYKQFLKSPNFASWLQNRSAELNREWRSHYMNVLCESDILAWGAERGRLEIECVDLLLRLKEEIAQYSKYFPQKEESGGTGRTLIFASSEVGNGFIPSLEQFRKLERQLGIVLAGLNYDEHRINDYLDYVTNFSQMKRSRVPSPPPDIFSTLLATADSGYALKTQRFFKQKYCGPTDTFIGLRVPQIRTIAKQFLDSTTPDVITRLMQDQRHEVRYCGLLTLVEAFKAPSKCSAWSEASQASVLALLLQNRQRIDNWDLVDSCVGPVIGGSLIGEEHCKTLTDFLEESPTSLAEIEAAITKHLPPFYQSLINSLDFWEIRMSIVSLQPLIKHGHHKTALLLLQHQLYRRYQDGFQMTLHGSPFDDFDLVNKALGWMLRELGRVDRMTLVAFLDKHAIKCAKTTVRYATEHFSRSVSAGYVSQCEK
ncbi:DNA alkylation repair enzyme-domain-containing protein [Obelidium mucronatum]|nr:DNA alkylation repair enzyme-domain-containing protein [Obelidium mucronatum]